jgi:PIN domain nuclease of toxin-antitoxin system
LHARDIIANPDNDVLVSSASIWEVSIKAGLRRLDVELDDLEDAIARNGFRSLPIGFRHAITAGRLRPCTATRLIGCSSPKQASKSCGWFLIIEYLSGTV